ncbi:MAG: PAS domain S-box protein [Hyphomonadaceae bacterium]
MDTADGARHADVRFQEMADSAPAPAWITDADGRITFVNQAFCDLAGLSREALAGDAWLRLMHPDDLPGVAARRAAAWAANFAPYEFTARFKSQTGAWLWMRASAQPRFSESGTFLGYVGMAVDETAARAALAELAESESRRRMVQEAGSIGCFDWDMRSNRIYRSPEYLALQGLPADVPTHGEFSDAWTDRLHPDDRAWVTRQFRIDIAQPGAFEREYRIVRPDNGETRWILNRGRVEGDAEGRPVRLLSAQTDITRHKQTEEALRDANERLQQSVAERTWQLQHTHGRLREQSRMHQEAEAESRDVAEQFRLLVQGVTDYALYLLSPQGHVTTWNVGAERIKGYSADEIVGEHFSRFYVEEDRARGEPALALQTAREAGRYEREAWRLRKDGSRFMAHVVIDAIRDRDGDLIGFAKITRDVTERYNAQRELEAAREALTQAQKMEMVGQLTGGLAHDFNNMLAGIIGALNLLQRRIAAQRFDDTARYIDAALTSAHRAAALTSRLLAFGRRQSLDIKPIDVAAAVRSMDILLQRSLGENVRLRMELAPAVALTDANQFEAALLNLAVNARDAMPDGGELMIAVEGGDDGFVRVRVRDTGVGMAPEVLEQVFEPFFTTKPIGQGTGLGLSMVHGFVKQSGGDVQIVSTPGAGAEVIMLLPATALSPEHKETARPAEKSGAGETVLVVEDDAQVRMLVLEVLSELGYKALEAGDARAALALLERNKIDLMVSDVGLPGMNGRQLAEMARARAPSLKVLFMTGYAEHAQVRSTFLGEGMDLVTKPFELDALAAKIREMVAL